MEQVVTMYSDRRPEFAIKDNFTAWMLANVHEWKWAQERRILVDVAKATAAVAALGGLQQTYHDGNTRYTGHVVSKCKVTTQLMGSFLWFAICGPTEALVKEVAASLLALEIKPTKNEPRVPINFRTVQNSYQRLIEVPKFDDIQTNYPNEVLKQMAELFRPGYRPPTTGQLILWHGEPGTGKTWLLRALASEWRQWCKTTYIIDPDNFFAGPADYTIQVLLGDQAPILFDDDEEPAEDAGEAPWKLVIAEDTGELLTQDAKQHTGQGLSRLLNIVDGMVGQGLKTLVLITTNEPIAKMHPAVVRNGRCLNKTEFGLFSPEQARAWIKAHQGDPSLVKSKMRLADLYALLDGKVPEGAPLQSVGFARETA